MHDLQCICITTLSVPLFAIKLHHPAEVCMSQLSNLLACCLNNHASSNTIWVSLCLRLSMSRLLLCITQAPIGVMDRRSRSARFQEGDASASSDSDPQMNRLHPEICPVSQQHASQVYSLRWAPSYQLPRC
jgi:hypothetical protein